VEPIVSEGIVSRVKELAALVNHQPGDSPAATVWVDRIHDLAERVETALSPGDRMRNFEEFQVELLGWRNQNGS